MKRRDYKCKCGAVREILVPDEEPFPETIPCYECKGQAKKMFAAIPSHTMLGSAGNYSNGYTSTGGYIKKTK